MRGANHAQTIAFHAARDWGVPVVVSDREVVLILSQDEFTEILAIVARIRAEEAIKTEVDEQLLSDDPDLTPDQ